MRQEQVTTKWPTKSINNVLENILESKLDREEHENWFEIPYNSLEFKEIFQETLILQEF